MGISDGIPPRWKSSNPKIRPADCSAGQDPLPARISCRNRMATGQFALSSMLLAAAISVVSGCNATLMDNINRTAPTRLSDDVPPFRLDSSASMVIYDGNDSPDEADADEARAALANLIQTRYGRGGVTPARFLLRVHVHYWWWVFILCVDTQILGCPTGYTSARTTLELQVGDRFFVGHGQGSGYGGLYYNKLTGIQNAVGEAIGDAVANLFPS